MNYGEATDWLFGARMRGVKLGLDNTELLLDAFDRPDDAMRIIHAAGTNGKGSVCAMVDALCRAAGKTCGLFTSPHLITFRERIRTNGEMISRPALAEGITRIREAASRLAIEPTYFEIATILAMLEFRERGMEFAAIETGLGGRLDSTNALESNVSVITRIGLDHQDWLGSTLAGIGYEKAGIIKPGQKVVVQPQLADARVVVHTAANQRGAEVLDVRYPYPHALERLPGYHQQWNAATAIVAVEAAGLSLDTETIDRAFNSVEWQGRFQRVGHNIVLDAAHNPDAISSLVETWASIYREERATVIFGVMNDKDAATMAGILDSIAVRVIATTVKNDRSMRGEDLARIVSSTCPELPCMATGSLPEALAEARKHNGRILVTGSLFLVGETLHTLQIENQGQPENLTQ